MWLDILKRKYLTLHTNRFDPSRAALLILEIELMVNKNKAL